MRSTLVYRDGHLCVLNEFELRKGRLGGAFDNTREWYVIREVDEEAEARAEAARLLADHPRSPHAAAVRESCGGPNGSPNP